MSGLPPFHRVVNFNCKCDYVSFSGTTGGIFSVTSFSIYRRLGKTETKCIRLKDHRNSALFLMKHFTLTTPHGIKLNATAEKFQSVKETVKEFCLVCYFVR